MQDGEAEVRGRGLAGDSLPASPHSSPKPLAEALPHSEGYFQQACHNPHKQGKNC